MSRVIDTSKPLSDEDRQYMLDRGLEQQIAVIDARHSGEEGDPLAHLPAGAGDTLPHTVSPDAVVPTADGANTDPSAEGAAAADAFNGSGAAGDDDEESDEERDVRLRAAYEDYTVEDLKEILRGQEKPTSGNKPDLIDRLVSGE